MNAISSPSLGALPSDRLVLSADGSNLANNLSIAVTEGNQIISMTGEAIQSMYATILGLVNFVNNEDEPGDRSVSINFTIRDDEFVAMATSTVQLVSTNDPVFISFYPTKSLTYNEESQQPLFLFQNDTLSDSDGNMLQNITISIVNIFDENDQLAAVADELTAEADELTDEASELTGEASELTGEAGDSGLQVTVSNSSGAAHTLVLSGNASLAVYEAVLRSATFINTFPGLNTYRRNITVVTCDGMTESPPHYILLDIVAFDDPSICYFGQLVSHC